MVGAGADPAPIPLKGDVQDCAEAIWALAADLCPGQALAFGGETTVRLIGDGMGGRNQELALRLALLAEARPVPFDWAFASVGSDGRDGPGEAAGGLVVPGTPRAIRAGGIDPVAALARNDSTPALAAGDALVPTGATGTNVADLAVLVRAAGAWPGARALLRLTPQAKAGPHALQLYQSRDRPFAAARGAPARGRDLD